MKNVVLIKLLILATLTTAYSQNSQPVFTLLSSDQTAVKFRNDISDTRESNFFKYKNFYQGGGIALGDINNDGLQDIYFTGNQVGDKLYLNKGNLQFEDITLTAGIIDDGNWSTGVTIIDVNDDGYKDIYVCKSLYHNQPERRRNKLYINNGNQKFTESAEDYGLDDPWRTQHASFFDYDRDGDMDIFIINQPPNSSKLAQVDPSDGSSTEHIYRLLENTSGKFEDVTAKAGLLNRGFGLSGTIGDFNNDGWQDIYVANDYDGADFFYVNNQDGTFTNELRKAFMHISNFSMGSDAGDINNDGWLDISVVDMVAEDNYRLKANMSGMNPDRFWQTVAKGGHYQYMFNTLQLNNGHTGDDQVIFSDIAQLTGTSNTDWSWSPLLADFDNNGHLDLFVTNGIKREMRNTDALAQMDSYIKTTIEKHKKNNSNNNEFDIWDLIELDSMLSFFPSQKLKNYIYANKGELEFEYVSDKWGLDQTSFSTGAAYGDLDNDGDLDLVVSNIDEEAFVYKNNTNENLTNNFLRIIIEGNGSYLGTRATVYYDNKLQMAELSGASGISSSSEDVLHFGLGENIVDSLKIDWFDGGSSMLRNVGIGVLKINPLKLEKKYKSVSTTIKRSQFEEVTEKRGINFIHKENRFDDYGREVLLPHRMSTMGSGLAVGDIDGNSLEDFFIGAAAGNKGQIYFQQKDGNFKASELSEFAPNLNFEDMGSALFDADLDGDLDLYIVSGGNEYAQGSEWQQDRFYVNEGKKLIAKTGVLPDLRTSGGRVKVGDYDKDGDLDLFVGGRQVPGRYPEPANSYILQNQWMESGRLSFITVAEFEKMGMVTDGVWTDYDVDGDLDLLVIGEWMEPTIIENKKGKFTQKKLELSIDNAVGWWYSLSSSDLDGDGDDDYILGNLGENYKYKATQEEPFTVHYDDFDANGSNDIVLGYYNYGEHFPLRGRSCSSQQIPDIKKQFTNYHEFAIASLKQVYGEASLDEALYYEAGIFSSICLENMGKGKFKVRRLPIEAQFSSINSSVIMDIDKDGVKDLIIVGNLFGAEIETPRNDAGLGLYLKGKGNCTFEPVPMHESGLRLPYDVKEIKKIQLTDGEGIVVAVNNGSMKLIKIK